MLSLLGSLGALFFGILYLLYGFILDKSLLIHLHEDFFMLKYFSFCGAALAFGVMFEDKSNELDEKFK